MNNSFSQPKLIYKIFFILKYKDIEVFENFFPEDVLGICTYEVESSTIDSQDNDLWAMEVLVDAPPELSSLVRDLENYAQIHNINFHSEVTLQQVEDKDWVAEYQKQLKPIEIGRFFITSSTMNVKCPKNKIPIYIEASRAFGTGDHATTSLCIDAMNSLKDSPIRTVFDIGTGSGILSFVAEKIWPTAKILACDIEEVSIKIAKDNIVCNNSNAYFYQNSEQDLNIPREWEKKFDLIVSNILASPLISMSKTIRNLVHKNTIVILSGFLDYQVPDVVEAYGISGFSVLNDLEKDRWIMLMLQPKSN
jgi:ribosomal protein L11 methyltransferase